MLFNSLPFLFIFLPSVLTGYWLVGKTGVPTLNMVFLAAASLVFYGYYHPGYVPLLILSVLFNYAVGVLILRGDFRKTVLAVGIAANVGVLCYYKYTAFLFANINQSFGTAYPIPEILLPLAISFFTFQQITYLVDQYRGEVREQGFLRYAVCVLFFPHLIAGPIVHYRKMMPQFTRPTLLRLRADHLAVGISLLAVGLFKKTCIADPLDGLISPVFGQAALGQGILFSDAWIATLAFTFQIYFDFSGYTDMALGLARMFGIRLPTNFYSPYKAGNIIDFWRRWHITLSRFLRDYIYIPLGGNRKGPARQLLNLIITMVVAGLWHGAAWHFVWWGLIHGFALAVNHLWQRRRPQGWPKKFWYRAFSFILTFLTVAVAWVFFRALDLETAMRMLHAMTVWTPLSWEKMQWQETGILSMMALICVMVFALPNTMQLGKSDSRPRWKISAAWAAGVVVLLIAGILQLVTAEGEVQEFIYWQF